LIVASSDVFALFVVFVRTGTCLMLLPGFGALQIPGRIRLYSALGITFAIFPLIGYSVSGYSDLSPAQMLNVIFAEMIIGAVLALPIRLFMLAILFMGEVITQMIGLNAIPGMAVGDDQAGTTLSSLMNLSAITLFFVSGLHINFFIALVASYSVYPIGEFLHIGNVLESLTGNVNDSFKIVIRLAAPLLICSIILNLTAGLVNKLTPQIPIYFVSAPFLITSGLILLVWIGDDILLLFNSELSRLIEDLL